LGACSVRAVRSAAASRYSRDSAAPGDLPPGPLPDRFNHPFRRMAAASLLRPRFAMRAGTGILTGPTSAPPPSQRVRLSSRLTLIRLALIRKPWTSGVRVSHPHCRYSCLHLPFRTLQRASPARLRRIRNAPLPMHQMHPTASAVCFMPAHHPYPTARPVSCYALFE